MELSYFQERLKSVQKERLKLDAKSRAARNQAAMKKAATTARKQRRQGKTTEQENENICQGCNGLYEDDVKIVRQAGLAVMKEDVGDGIIIGVLVNLMSQIQSYDGYAQPAKKRMKYSDILTLNQ